MATAASSCASGAQEAQLCGRGARACGPSRRTLRLTLGTTSTDADVEAAATAVRAAIERLELFS